MSHPAGPRPALRRAAVLGSLLLPALCAGVLMSAATAAAAPGDAPAAVVTTAPKARAAKPVVAPTASPRTTKKRATSNKVEVNLDDTTKGGLSSPLAIVLLLGLVSVVPALLIMVTAFTRIVIVLGFTRSALSTNGIPPNQVIIGLSLFLTLFVMGPVFSKANHDGLQPYLKGRITQTEAFDRSIEPFRGFMLKQVREKDLGLFVKMSGKPAPATPADVPTTTLIPAFVLSELRAAFLIGFVIFIPFLVIDLVVSAALSSMGMVMLPPVLISLPFKLLLFVAADGWYLVVQSLVESFHA